jgi:hypothetical protein
VPSKISYIHTGCKQHDLEQTIEKKHQKANEGMKNAYAG